MGRILPSRRIAAATPIHSNEHPSLIGDPDKRRCRILTLVHPVLFHLGSILIPSYGAVTALGVLLALFLAERSARVAVLNAGAVWNLCAVALFAALIGSRLLLIALNWSALRLHPAWMLTLAMIHHPLLGAFGALVAAGSAVLYGRWKRLPLWSTADALAAPVALGMAFEQLGALLAGSGYGTETAARWAVTYIDPLAARWSGTPLGVAVHPVQAYAALGFLTLSILLLALCQGTTLVVPPMLQKNDGASAPVRKIVGLFRFARLSYRRQPGDVAGLLLLGTGVVVFITEFWRDSEGRGALLGGALNGPQAVAVALVVIGGLALLERADPVEGRSIPPFRPKEGERMGHGELNGRK
ncbi:MAG: prolipoprotein diacylglyceryl transferase [Terracidiphilus sp.]